jgi:hypothetical protein
MRVVAVEQKLLKLSATIIDKNILAANAASGKIFLLKLLPSGGTS